MNMMKEFQKSGLLPNSLLGLATNIPPRALAAMRQANAMRGYRETTNVRLDAFSRGREASRRQLDSASLLIAEARFVALRAASSERERQGNGDAGVVIVRIDKFKEKKNR